jgi:hypothetical protein
MCAQNLVCPGMVSGIEPFLPQMPLVARRLVSTLAIGLPAIVMLAPVDIRAYELPPRLSPVLLRSPQRFYVVNRDPALVSCSGSLRLSRSKPICFMPPSVGLAFSSSGRSGFRS